MGLRKKVRMEDCLEGSQLGNHETQLQTKLEDTKSVNVDSNIQLEAEICRLEKELKEEQRRAFIVNFG